MSEHSDKWQPRSNNPRFLCPIHGIYVTSCTHFSTCGACKIGKNISKGVKNVEKRPDICEKTSKRGARGPYKVRTRQGKIDEKQPIKVRKTAEIKGQMRLI